MGVLSMSNKLGAPWAENDLGHCLCIVRWRGGRGGGLAIAVAIYPCQKEIEMMELSL